MVAATTAKLTNAPNLTNKENTSRRHVLYQTNSEGAIYLLQKEHNTFILKSFLVCCHFCVCSSYLMPALCLVIGFVWFVHLH